MDSPKYLFGRLSHWMMSFLFLCRFLNEGRRPGTSVFQKYRPFTTLPSYAFNCLAKESDGLCSNECSFSMRRAVHREAAQNLQPMGSSYAMLQSRPQAHSAGEPMMPHIMPSLFPPPPFSRRKARGGYDFCSLHPTHLQTEVSYSQAFLYNGIYESWLTVAGVCYYDGLFVTK